MKNHLIDSNATIQEAIKRLDNLAVDALLFVVDGDNKLLGSITDGDVRRGLIHGIQINSRVLEVMNSEPKRLHQNELDIQKTKEYREKNYKIIPIVNNQNQIVDLLNFRLNKTRLPIDVVIMAGGRGSRLLPLTEKVPKPLLKVGEKSIIEHVIDGLALYGVKNIDISINYLGSLIKDEFGDGSSKGLNIKYIEEEVPLGTMGALALKESFLCPYTLVLNSDLLTAIDYEDYFLDFLNKKADLSAVGIPYKVDIPYGIFELNDDRIIKINEKPTYTYFSNGGIYLFKSEFIQQIPKGKPYLATEFIEELVLKKKKAITYSLLEYWLDIGNPSDFERAQIDIKHLKF
jgi:dTDP-glucose pyrophosphorylase